MRLSAGGWAKGGGRAMQPLSTDPVPLEIEPGAGVRRRGLALAVILIAALALRLAHWAGMRRGGGRSGAGGGGAGDWLGHGVFFQAPLYPYLVALLYVVFGRSLDAVYLVQIGCAVAGCYA